MADLVSEPEPIITCSSVRHWFDCAWSGTDGDGFGVLYCKACGEIRPIEVPTIGPPIEEMIPEWTTTNSTPAS